MSVSSRRPLIGAVAGLALAALPTSAIAAGIGSPAPLAEVTTDPSSPVSATDPDPQVAALDEAAVECMAKVVLHEAGREPYDGKVAVARTLVNRLGAKRFGGTICAVANQRGQFFNTAAYDPDRDGQGWATAVQVARAVLSGDADDVAPGAMFFHSAAQAPSSFFRSRQRVASIGRQVFYR